MGLARIQRYMAGKEAKVAVVVGTVTDDVRLDGHAFPALKVCALRFTEGARARITKNGGQCMTFDQLALQAPRGQDTVLLRGRRNARTANKYFGAPGVPDSETRPRIAHGSKVRTRSERSFSQGANLHVSICREESSRRRAVVVEAVASRSKLCCLYFNVEFCRGFTSFTYCGYRVCDE